MKKLATYVLLFTFFAQAVFAGLPPTTSKVTGDAGNVTTFNYQFPNFAGTHTGTTLSLGVLGIVGGGTGQATAGAGFGALSPLTTKGDILSYSSSNARQAVPGDNGGLVPDSNQTNGWRSASYTQYLNGRPGKNYIQYADFENNATTGWSLGTVGTLTNGLPTGAPTFGSGASGNLSISNVSSSQLAGSYSISYVSSAATTQGNMLASSSYAIDTSDQAKVMTVKFYYSTNSGASNNNYSGTSSNSFAWAVYDVTNSAWLSSAGNFCMTQSSGVGYCTGTFQTGSSTANIRFVLYNANASSGATTLYFDDFYIGPQTAPMGPAMSDWVSWTPTGTWSTNTTYTGWYRKTGDSLSMIVKIALAGAPTSASLTVTLPNSWSIDTTKLPGTPTNQVIGQVTGQGAAHTFSGVALYSSTTAFAVDYTLDGSTASIMSYAAVTQAAPYTFANNDFIYIYVDNIPISGWSSNTSMSSDTDTRVVAMQVAQASPTATIVSGESLLKFTSAPTTDTHAGYSTSTGGYTCPVTGNYRATAQVDISATYAAGNYSAIGIGKNSTSSSTYKTTQKAGGVQADIYPFISVVIQCNAGDVLYPLVQSNATTPTVGSNATQNFFMVERLSGPAVVAASESVNATYTGTASTTGTHSAWNAVAYSTKSYDSHNAYNTSTGAYTCPVAGKYRITSSLAVTLTPSAALNFLYISIMKNVTNAATYQQGVSSINTSAGAYAPQVSATISCNAGDALYIGIENGMNTTDSVSLLNNAFAYFSIERVGN